MAQAHDGIRHFDQSTWLAHRANEAAEIGPPQPPTHVALPGAKQAVPHALLMAFQDAGHSEHQVVEHVNARFDAANADRLAAHNTFVNRYQAQIEEARQRAAQDAAEALRRKAAFEAWMAERGHE